MGPTLTRTRRRTGKPDGVEQAPDNPVLARVQHNLDQHVARGGVHQLEGVHRGEAVLEFHAFLELGADSLRERSADLDQVGLGDLVGRVRQAVGEFAVVRQQQQALGGDVQAAHVEQAFALWVFRTKSLMQGRPSGSSMVDTTPLGLLNTM